MPVTANTYIPFDAGAGASVTESGWRSMARHWIPSGVLVTDLAAASWDAELKVTAGVGLQVSVAAGEAWIRGHYAEWTGSNDLAVGSNSSGSTRVDLVVARAHFVDNDIELDIVAGTPGAGAPALTQNTTMWEIPLAQYSVTNGGTAPTSIVDTRVFTGYPARTRRDIPGTLVAEQTRNTDYATPLVGALSDLFASDASWDADGGEYMIEFYCPYVQTDGSALTTIRLVNGSGTVVDYMGVTSGLADALWLRIPYTPAVGSAAVNIRPSTSSSGVFRSAGYRPMYLRVVVGPNR